MTMAGVRVRRRGPAPLGRLHVMLGADRHVYVRWSPADGAPAGHDVDTGPGRIAAVACVDWMVRHTLVGHGWNRRQISGHLERACRTPSAPDYNARTGTLAVRHSAPPVGTVGPSVHVDASWVSTPAGEGRIQLTWSVPPQLGEVSESERLVAALWAVAGESDHGESVHPALCALRGGFEESGGFDPAVADDLLASLLLFGDETAATERRAREWRSRLRVV